MPPNLNPPFHANAGRTPLHLILEDGAVFSGVSFGSPLTGPGITGEVVFNTGMVGYPESFTDPSYRGQILALTYPLIGNYGVPADSTRSSRSAYESDAHPHRAGSSSPSTREFHHHWNAGTRRSRTCSSSRGSRGSAGSTRARSPSACASAGRWSAGSSGRSGHRERSSLPPRQPSSAEVSHRKPQHVWRGQDARAACRLRLQEHASCARLVNRGVTVVTRAVGLRSAREARLSTACSSRTVRATRSTARPTIETARKRRSRRGMPIFGICLGNQILALAAGAKTYKLKFGHRGQNQPCVALGGRALLHHLAEPRLRGRRRPRLPEGLEAWFINANDGTNEGIRHRTQAVHARAVPPRGDARPGRHGVPLRRILSDAIG